MPRLPLPAWLRRALEAATVAAIVSIGSLAGEQLTTGPGAYPLPAGPAGMLLLAPAVLALGVVTSAYPPAMAATRGDAALGSVAAFLVAADLTIILAGGRILLEPSETNLPGGLLVGLVALPAATVGVVAGQLLTPLGFGRRAGAIGAIVSAGTAVALLLIIGMVA